MSNKFQLEVTDELVPNIQNWMAETFSTYAAHHGNGHDKKLMVNHVGTWIVTDHKKEVYRGAIGGAIRTFNNL